MRSNGIFSGLVLLVFLSFSLAANQPNQQVLKEKPRSNPSSFTVQSPQDWSFPNINLGFKGGVIWWESFETPRRWNQWVSKDLTVPRPKPIPSQWVLDTWDAYDGLSWRCADLSLGNHGGYNNHWYQVLDTPPILLTEDATFSFYHRYWAEAPTGVPEPYDAWDGMNVRISTDSGKTWQVLPCNTYNVSSIWAFGHPEQGHNEGPGIPGWAGHQDAWRMESIDLSAYTSHSTPVMLRFAFASDMAYCTLDNPDMFGWEIDNIEVKSANQIFFSNDGVQDGMVGKSNEFIPPPGGDLWHIVKFNDPIPPYIPEFTPHGRYAAACQHGDRIFSPDSTYNPYMDNVFSTGPIHLPDASPIYLDFKYVPNFFDNDNFPDVEFFRPEVKNADSTEWQWIEDLPYVYSFGFDRWLEFAWTYGYPMNTSMFDLSRFAGQDIDLRFRFWSDYDQPIGYGLLIDDIVIYSPTRNVPPPQNVQATPNSADTSIVISWDAIHPQVDYFIYRANHGSSQFYQIGHVKGTPQYKDKDIKPFYEYDYFVQAVVHYFGQSGPSDTTSAFVLPEGYVELAYDDGQPNGYIESGSRKKLAVLFTPASFPVTIKTFRIYLERGNNHGSAGQFFLMDVDQDGLPGAILQHKNRSALSEGYNVIEFPHEQTINSKGFYIAYSRFNTSPYVAKDTDPEIDGHTYEQTSDGWVQHTDCDAIIHAFVNISGSGKDIELVSSTESYNPSVIADHFILNKNFPNPFNPNTQIRFIVPQKAANEMITLEIFNVLGQKVCTLFSGVAAPGQHTIRWNGLSDGGQQVNSGIYIYRLSGKNVSITRRMLLLK